MRRTDHHIQISFPRRYNWTPERMSVQSGPIGGRRVHVKARAMGGIDDSSGRGVVDDLCRIRWIVSAIRSFPARPAVSPCLVVVPAAFVARRHLRNGDRRPPSRVAGFSPSRWGSVVGSGLGGRSPEAPARDASGTAGVCGSLAAGHRRTPRFPGGAALREPPFAGVSAESGPPSRGPYAAALPAPARALIRHGEKLRADRCLENSVGAIGWSSASRRCAGAEPRRSGASCAPARWHQLSFWPLRGSCRPGVGGVLTSPRAPRAAKGSYLVDSASSHMLVSKIKPCMSKCKHFIL